MNTQHLRYALEVERTRSITQAAENLFMAQPNLSKAIRELEEAIGIVIFDRSPKGVIPTAKGTRFLLYARAIVAQVDNMMRLSHVASPRQQALRVSIPRSDYISGAFTRFAASLDPAREIDVVMNETNSLQAIDDVVQGRSNIGVIRYRTDYEDYYSDLLAGKGLTYRLIWQFEYVVLLAQKHPLAMREGVNASELAPFTEIIHGDRVVPHLADSEREPREGMKIIRVFDRCSQLDMLANIPWTYMWGSPVYPHTLEQFGIVQRPCLDRKRVRRDVLIMPNHYQLTEWDQLFLDKLMESRDAVSMD